jgi:hypothetical protein
MMAPRLHERIIYDGANHPEEAADRLAIRELIDPYAHCAERRSSHMLLLHV